jgi:hypothetical protein
MAQKQQQIPKPRPIRDIRMSGNTESENNKKNKPHFRWPKLPKNQRVRWGLLIGAVLLIGLFAYNYIRTRNDLGQDETAKLTAEISKVLELPPSETPTLATVKDAAKLKSQPFFKDTQDGDKVLIYSQAGRAVLYRPTTKKVLEFSSISLGGNEAQPGSNSVP